MIKISLLSAIAVVLMYFDFPIIPAFPWLKIDLSEVPALMGGFALVKQNRVTILVNEAQSAETLNLDEAENNYNTAKTKLEQAEGQKQKVEANFLFKRARARYQLVKNN